MQSPFDIYHVIVRGVGRQMLFEDRSDRKRFMGALAERLEASGGEILAWCLMSNHAHLLIHAPLAELSKAMLSVECGYAKYFNAKYDRTGTLFQGRFASVPIADEGQLLVTVRYIHRNPAEQGGGLSGEWSSYDEYVGGSGYAKTGLVLGMFDGLDSFVGFHSQGDGRDAAVPRRRLTAQEASRVARAVLGEVNPYDIRSMEKGERDLQIRRLREAGLSIRQVERVTSIGRNIIAKA